MQILLKCHRRTFSLGESIVCGGIGEESNLSVQLITMQDDGWGQKMTGSNAARVKYWRFGAAPMPISSTDWAPPSRLLTSRSNSNLKGATASSYASMPVAMTWAKNLSYHPSFTIVLLQPQQQGSKPPASQWYPITCEYAPSDGTRVTLKNGSQICHQYLGSDGFHLSCDLTEDQSII